MCCLSAAFELKSVPHPRLSEEVPRIRWVRFEFLSQLREIETQVARVLHVLAASDMSEQRLPRDQVAGVPNQELRHLPLSWGQTNLARLVA